MPQWEQGEETGWVSTACRYLSPWLWRLSLLPRPERRHLNLMEPGPHCFLAPPREAGRCGAVVLHSALHTPHLTAPGGALSQCEGQDPPSQGWPLGGIKYIKALLSTSSTCTVPLPPCNHSLHLPAPTNPWGGLVCNGPQWGQLMLQDTLAFASDLNSCTGCSSSSQYLAFLGSAANAPWGSLKCRKP